MDMWPVKLIVYKVLIQFLSEIAVKPENNQRKPPELYS